MAAPDPKTSTDPLSSTVLLRIISSKSVVTIWDDSHVETEAWPEKNLIKAAIARLDPAVQVEGTFQKGHDFLWKSSISLAKAKIWELPMMIWQEEYRRFYDWTSFILQFNMKILNC